MACDNSKEARIWFRYGAEPWDNIISRSPPVSYTTVESTAIGNCDCELYLGDIVVPRFFWTGYGNTGTRVPVAPYRISFQAYGPIGSPAIRTTPRPGSYYGYIQDLFLNCRGFIGSACKAPGQYRVPASLTGGEANNHPYDPQGLRIENLRRMNNQPECPKCVFTVSDGTGTIFSQTKPTCPEVRIQCEDECPPGQERIGCCCVDCTTLVNQLSGLINSVRRL